MTTTITHIHAREIIDSRGNPTIEAEVTLSGGAFGRAMVPSGASVGSQEAIELRDLDPKRFFGKGVLLAVANVNSVIAQELQGKDAANQSAIDAELIQLDGTANKGRLGANAILSVSLAVAKAAAQAHKQPLYQYLAPTQTNFLLPVPQMNIINGGMHADNALMFQECMIMPIGASSFREALQMGVEVFHTLKDCIKQKGYSTSVGDEGGFAPQVRTTEEALDLIMQAISKAGYNPGSQIALALDVAASEFYQAGAYQIEEGGAPISSAALVTYYEKICASYPIISIEDAMSEHDHQGWQLVTARLGTKLQLVGDDLFVTNPRILKAGISAHLANSILIKPNQIGTLSETLATIALATQNNYRAILSHRSGETEDTTIADLAVATNVGQINTGSLCRSDRLAKYNQLLRIEEELGTRAQYAKFGTLAS